MMNVYQNPGKDKWKTLLARPFTDNSRTRRKVWRILKAVQKEGDAAIKKYSLQFDKIESTHLLVSKAEMDTCAGLLSPGLRTAIQTAAANIEKFHSVQKMAEDVIETMPGIYCWRREVAIETVGLYVPGGTAPLFSTVLMLAIPARLAGCKEIILCTPPGKDGNIHPAILYAACITGVSKIYKVGGAQAIAAMGYGTETIQGVSKIF